MPHAFRFPLLLSMVVASSGLLRAMPPRDGGGGGSADDERRFRAEIDVPNPKDLARIQQRLEWQHQQRMAGKDLRAEPKGLKKMGQDKVLVLLVEFAGTNTFTWTPGLSTWDPLGRCDNSEFDGVNIANSAASTFFAQKYGITAPTNLTYSGPFHNQIPRPLGSNDASAASVWLPDFSPTHYSNLVFGAGVVFDFTRQDGSVVYEDFTGKSVRDYYEDLSAKAYTISGTVLGWLKVTNSVWWYGADGVPGARSAFPRPSHAGAIPGAGNYHTLVIDALNAAKAAYPTFDWAAYDQDGDGEIDRLWIIHAGYGEEDNPGLLNRTGYGESGLWSHSWALGTPYQVVPGISANAYIMMPENAGIAVLAHEFGHSLGAIDLYTYGDGQTSAGFWTLMSDSWVGFPLGFLPEAMDPMHLDQWGWLSPLDISDPARVYTVTIGQASRFPAGPNLVRAVRIDLPDGPGGYTHNFYLQWRNTSLSGGYDQALGDPRFRFGPVNSGLLVWYQNDRYGDNSIRNYLNDPPSFGPKGKLLVVDAHPEPYLDPYWAARGIENERGIVFSRGLMRDAPFSRLPAVDFDLDPPFAYEPASFVGRPAVHWFSDAQGYYPGIQNLSPNPWRTWQWDASVVMPSSVSYGVRGPGYPAGGSLEQVIATRSFVGTNELLTYQTNAIPGGSSLAGGSGNPGDAQGDYGWNVWIVHQTDAAAEVVIWNTHFAQVDTDLDGFPDWQEAIAGTDPKDPNSCLRMTRAQVNAQNGTVQLEWTSATNRLYRLWRTTDLMSGFQTVLATNLIATPYTNIFVDLDPPINAPAFYRVEVQ